MTDGPHTSTAHTAAVRPLRRNDRSRYGLVRLTVTRTSSGRGVVSVVVRDVRGGYLTESRLHAATIDLEPGSAASQRPLEALRQALVAVLGEQAARA